MATKYVYFFGNGDAEGDESMRPILGGKGANLAQMAKAPLSLPVPPGFTISIDVCQEYYKLGKNILKDLIRKLQNILTNLKQLSERNLVMKTIHFSFLFVQVLLNLCLV